MTLSVYRWSFAQYAALLPPARAAVDAFLLAHGLPAAQVAPNTLVSVLRRPTNEFVLRVWCVEIDEYGERLYCPYCPYCLRQRLVDVPLAAPVPVLPGAHVDRESGLDVVEIQPSTEKPEHDGL